MPDRPHRLLQSLEGNPDFKGKPSVCGEFLIHSNPTGILRARDEESEYFIEEIRGRILTGVASGFGERGGLQHPAHPFSLRIFPKQPSGLPRIPWSGPLPGSCRHE